MLTKGRTEPPRNNISGIKAVYLFSFVDYAYNLIEGVRGVEITSFPSTTLYKYETSNAVFSETINNDEKGVSYEQSLTFTLFKQDLLTTNELDRLTKIDLRYIIELNDGSFKMAGVYNGVSLEDYSIESGGSKSDLNGYNLTFNSIEEYAAPFLTNLNVLGGYLLLEDNFNLLLEDSELIILE